MSTIASGNLIDDQSPAQGLANLVVVVRDESSLFSSDLGTATSGKDGSFTVPYSGDLTPELGTRKLGIYVFTQSHRQLYYVSQSDIPGAVLPLGNIPLPRAEAAGWTVTLGGSANALPVREGNAVRILIDNEAAWGHLADAMEGAAASINVMQLEFDVPPDYSDDPPSEQPEIVLSFDAPVDPVKPRQVLDAQDYRPERILLDKASHGLKVRVIMAHQNLGDAPAGVLIIEIILALILLALFPVGIYVVSKYLTLLRGWKNLQDYLEAAGSTVDDQGFQVTPFNVVHAKLVLVDDTEAIVVGSPFNQSYFDSHQHHVYEPRRGSASGEPVGVHDVSLGVRGPAVKDIHDAFRLHWNTAEPGAAVTAIATAPPVTSLDTTGRNPEDAIASLQLVRTLNAGAFPAPLDKGERGILEAYLRAIEQATGYIYLENQYFTNETIGQALVAALNDTKRPTLQIIVMLNVTPDIPMYPGWQSKLIQRIRKDAGTNASRIEFFTAWTHDPAMESQGRSNPMIMANYLHTKAAIVDGKWATIGSANLDGASLDAFQLLHALQFADNVNHELNYTFFNGIDGHPAAGAQPDAIDLLRRRLWGEHLGIVETDKQLDASNGDWLTLWKTIAAKKLSGLTTNPATTPSTNPLLPTLGRVLMYPPDQDKTIVTGQGAQTVTIGPATNSRSFLQNLAIPFDSLDLVEHVRSFRFDKGEWV